jgi:alpha-glucosidase
VGSGRKGLLVIGGWALLAACGRHFSSSWDHGRGLFVSNEDQLAIAVLADDMLRFTYSRNARPLSTSTPMIVLADSPSPSRLVRPDDHSFETASLHAIVDRDTLCIELSSASGELTAICPHLATQPSSMTLAPATTQNAYGLGEHFDGATDLAGYRIDPGSAIGDALVGFAGGYTGRAQFPILYALGARGDGYAVFLDDAHAQSWDLGSKPWRVTFTDRGSLDGYLIAGSVAHLRSRYLDLVGRPLVPPKAMFGLWVSQYSYASWSDMESKLGTLRAGRYPVDGFMLDVKWFGDTLAPSHMGALTWDLNAFPDPSGEIARLRDREGVGVMTIEEPYVDHSRPEHDDLAARGYLAKTCASSTCGPATVASWWGKGGMLDFTREEAADYWHETKRRPLIDAGVSGHWMDLGEPDDYRASSFYSGIDGVGASEADVHDLYGLEWIASVSRGYARDGSMMRPFMLSRAGAPGIERFGAAMWSGDIGSNVSSLSAQIAAQLHMSMSGIDYYGSDIGGFYRDAIDGDLDELYTMWFADSMLSDVPARPHTNDLCGCRETAPDRIGDRASNLENLRMRYRLLPYVYSLAHRAHRYGEPPVRPLFYAFPADASAREIADQKMLGPSLLFATASAYGQEARDVYLPPGDWTDFSTAQRVTSEGAWMRGVPLFDGASRFKLPLFARAGAIIPMMTVDDQTMNTMGKRLDGTRRSELVLRIYADTASTTFTLYEDDGETIAYRGGAVQTTTISQSRSSQAITVEISPASGTYAGAALERDNVLEIVAPDISSTSVVKLGGAALSGWTIVGGVLQVRSGTISVGADKLFEIDLR